MKKVHQPRQEREGVDANLPFPPQYGERAPRAAQRSRGVAGGHRGQEVPGLCRRDRGERPGLRPRRSCAEPPTGRCAGSPTSPTSSPPSRRSRWPGPCSRRAPGNSPRSSSETAGPKPTRQRSSTRACYALRTKGPGHEKLLCFSGAFHGRTLGSLSCTPTPKYQDPYLPLLPGVVVAPYNDAAALRAYPHGRVCRGDR